MSVMTVIVMFLLVLVLVLILVAIIVIMLTRWRRLKRRRARQPTSCADVTDDAFHPYVVDDADKLSCGSRTPQNGLCHVSCASNGSMSPRQNPASPKRPVSYTLSVMTPPATDVDNLMRTHNYGSNAEELESAGRQPDTSRSPEFVGRSPAIKRSVAPISVDNGEASKGLNNLNKAENYRKKSECVIGCYLA